MKTTSLLFAAFLLSVAGMADAAGGRADKRLALAMEHAGEPVRSVHVASTQSWESLGDEELLLWTGPSRAFLLKLDGACHDLGSAIDIELRYQPPLLSAGFDSVRIRDRSPMMRMECRILEIRPVDVKAMRSAEKQAREASRAARAG